MTYKIYNKTNFHKHTFCIFQEVSFTNIKDLRPNFNSKSGSCYYFNKNGVYRFSNHWSRVANCRWRIEKNLDIINSKKEKLGFAKWSDFYQDNDFEKLYFIVLNQNNELNYFHKNNENYSNQVLRTSVETTKLIKQIRTLLEESAWAKYLKVDNIEILRQEIIERLVNSNQNFKEIRREYL